MLRRKFQPVRSQLEFRLLSARDIKKIHEAALEVMEEVGVRFPSNLALDVLEQAGCQVNRETMVAKLPSKLVVESLRQAPSQYLLAGRDPKDDMWIDDKTSYLSTDGCAVEVYDIETGKLRTSTKQDITDACKVADYLPEISYVWGPPVSAQDVPAITRPLHEIEASMDGTTMHIQPETVISRKIAEYALEMAAVVAGGKEELRKRPIFSFMQCAMDPLGQDGGSLEASMVAAEWGIPTGFMPMPMSCATAPATLAGNLVVTTVDAVSPLVLMQLVNPGTPVYFAAAPTAIDLQTGGYTGGGPEDFLLAAAFSEICHFYQIPLAMGAFATGAKEPDWQAAVDNSFAGLMPVLTRTAILNGAGTLNGSKIFSLQQLIMDAEIYSMIAKVAEGIEVNDETLAVDVIKKIG
ncbi:MAG TPA: trimethylamine methyltransferase family protein, partial [Bacillota bacterium]|nr:trimethylamine methyltransferase family protein [Bacillota bacterium]